MSDDKTRARLQRAAMRFAESRIDDPDDRAAVALEQAALAFARARRRELARGVDFAIVEVAR